MRGAAVRWMVVLGGLCLGVSGRFAWADAVTIHPEKANAIEFPAQQARFVRFLIHDTSGGQPCIDELEVYGPQGERNLALARAGAKPTASSCLPGYAIHRVAHLADGQYGNDHSWIAAGRDKEWAQIELSRPAEVNRVVFSRDRGGRYRDRLPLQFEIRLSTDGRQWQTVRRVKAANSPAPARRGQGPAVPEALRSKLDDALGRGDLLRYALLCEAHAWRTAGSDPLRRAIDQMEALLDRFAARGIDVTAERTAWKAASARREAVLDHSPPGAAEQEAAYLAVRMAKRRLLFRDPELAPLEDLLFVKRHPFEPSHNYSVILDARGGPGGGVCRLQIPRGGGRLAPEEARLTILFAAGDGIARNPAASFDAQQVYFAYRTSKNDFFHLMVMGADGSGVRQLTDGPFHDFWPCPLPDGGLAFISTRCRARFLCWRPQVFVLFRMDSQGGNVRALSHANLSEWAPAVMRDGRIAWMRSEYLDKGADFGHTLWAIRPDGTHPELIFGNNTINCYANGREVPDTKEFCCTLVSHGGDLNGPIALIDPARGRFNPEAITSITPDVRFHTHMSWPRRQCFRDPVPVSRDYVVCGHAPLDRFGLFVIDRYGNRELLYLDPAIGSMCPTLFRAPGPAPVVAGAGISEARENESRVTTAQGSATGDQPWGRLLVADVYHGLGPDVPRGAVKYLRVCQEVRADLLPLADGGYQADHKPFRDWYATPIHHVKGPNGWPSYVAKGTFGLVPVEADGSAHFLAPAGKVLYFQALDGQFNELQRMRSVMQLQPGETRSCIGCHENRMSAPAVRPAIAMKRPPDRLEPPPWGAGPLAYETVVQPVLNARCVRCHQAGDKDGIDLTGTLDAERVPASYRTLIEGGWVHYFDYHWHREHQKAEPRTFGTLRSKLWAVLDSGHHDAELTTNEMRAIKCWIDLNCPLWSDYQFRPNRPPTSPLTLWPEADTAREDDQG